MHWLLIHGSWYRCTEDFGINTKFLYQYHKAKFVCFMPSSHLRTMTLKLGLDHDFGLKNRPKSYANL